MQKELNRLIKKRIIFLYKIFRMNFFSSFIDTYLMSQTYPTLDLFSNNLSELIRVNSRRRTRLLSARRTFILNP